MMNFKPITLSELKTLRPFFDRQPYELCPYLLPSIIAWESESYSPYGAVVDGDLIVCAQYKEGRRLMLPISSLERYPPPALKALAVTADVDIFWFVSEQYLQYYGKAQTEAYFHIEEQPKYSDYVYRAEDLAELKGNRYSKKRNLINQFKRNYIGKGRVEVAPISPADTMECIDFLEEWCISNECDAADKDELACEKQAAIHTLTHLETFGSRGLMLRIDGEICAFGIGARLTETMGVLNFEKAFSDIKGLYQYFDQECARQLFDGLQYINKENDMGEPGLQKAKLSYYPVRIVKSYQLTVR